MIFEYFNEFPIINYNGVNVRDLSRRVTLSQKLRRIPTAFHPFELNDDIRSDQLAYMYYNQSSVDWLIYLTNGIVDSYYGWYLNDDEFDSFIINKYGSLEDPQLRVFFWETNWSDDEFDLMVNGYNSMPEERRKYWTPNFGQNGKILSYRRRREDWHMNTNKIINLAIDDTSSFKKGDLVTAYSDGKYVGRAEVDAVISSTRLYLFHVLDNWDVGSEIRHRNIDVQTLGSSDTSGPTIQATNLVYENITEEEGSYWEPVYYYDYERMQNEARKVVLLLDANYLHEAVSAFVEKIKED